LIDKGGDNDECVGGEQRFETLSLNSEIDFYGKHFLMFVLDGIAPDMKKRFDDFIKPALDKSELPIHQITALAIFVILKTFGRNN
jgi:hypothetical protein